MSTIIHVNQNYERLDDYHQKPIIWKQYFTIKPVTLLKNMFYTFWPPPSKIKINVDLVGPILSMLILLIIIHIGQTLQGTQSSVPPIIAIILYMLINTTFSFILMKLGGTVLAYIEVFCLIGYGLFCHILTIFVSLLFYKDFSDKIFFCCFVILGGLSALKLVLIFMFTIRKPVIRLLVGTFTTSVHLLFLIFIYFSYIHLNFVYGSGHRMKIENRLL